MNRIVSAVGPGERIVIHGMNVNAAGGAVVLLKLALFLMLRTFLVARQVVGVSALETRGNDCSV